MSLTCPGHYRLHDDHPDGEQREPRPDQLAGRRSSSSPASRATATCSVTAGRWTGQLHRAVLQHDLQVIGSAMISAAQRDLLKRLPETPYLNSLALNRSRSSSVAFQHACAAPATTPGRRARPPRAPEAGLTASPPSSQTRIASTMPPMPSTDRTAPTRSDLPGSGVRHVVDQPDARQHNHDDDVLEQERDPPRQVGRDEPSDQRADRGGDRGRGPDQRVGLPLGRHPRSCHGSVTASPAAAARRRARR